MDALRYINSDATICFPYIIPKMVDGTLNAAMRILFRDRVDEDHPVMMCGPSNMENVPEGATVITVSTSPPPGFEPASPGTQAAIRRVGLAGTILMDSVSGDTCFLIEGGSRPNLQRIAALLPHLAPRRFREKALTDWEKSFLTVLATKSTEDVRAKVEEYIKINRIKEKIVTMQLDSFVNQLLERKMASAKREEKDILEEMRNYEVELVRLAARYRQVCDILLGIRAGHSDAGIRDFCDSLAHNPNCKVMKTAGTALQFRLNAFLTNFDEDKYSAVSRDERSCLFDYGHHLGITWKELKKIFDELFLGNRYRLNTFGVFTLDVSGNSIALNRNTGDHENAIPNPHVYHYACRGGFAQDFAAALQDSDYMEVLDIAFSEVANINWTDYSPVGRFSEDFCYSYAATPCVWDKVEKKFITPAEMARRVKHDELCVH